MGVGSGEWGVESGEWRLENRSGQFLTLHILLQSEHREFRFVLTIIFLKIGLHPGIGPLV